MSNATKHDTAGVIASKGTAKPAGVTMVLCVESGPIEEMTVRLVQSLRRFGGRLADSPVLAFSPRLGPPLSVSTRRCLENLGVDYHRIPGDQRYAWYPFLNKPLSLAAAEELATTEFIAWLDGDTLVVREPAALFLPSSTHFGGCAPDIGVIGSTGPDDPNEPYWRATAGVLGINLNEMPFLTTHLERQRIRLYLQAGVFVYRRNANFSGLYLRFCIQLLHGRIALYNGAHWLEQMALGFALHASGMSWQELPWSHNLSVGSYLAAHFDQDLMNGARIIHYHDAMGGPFWSNFLGYLQGGHPDVHEWLSALGPVNDRRPVLYKAVAQLLRGHRSLRRRRHRRRCRVIEKAGVG